MPKSETARSIKGMSLSRLAEIELLDMPDPNPGARKACAADYFASLKGKDKPAGSDLESPYELCSDEAAILHLDSEEIPSNSDIDA